jgi:isoleucyl-tRNA synthetase
MIDSQVIEEMALVQRLVSMGLAARNTVNIKVRQPLSRIEFATRDVAEGKIVARYADLICSELNVKSLGTMDAGDAESLVKTVYNLNPIPRLLGKKFGDQFRPLQAALREGDQAAIRPYAEKLLAGENVLVQLGNDTFEVTPEEVEVKVMQEVAEGYAVTEDSGYVAVLSTVLTEELVSEGLAREVVRRVQTMRREADFKLDDRIEIRYSASERMSQAIGEFSDYIRTETLSEAMLQDGTGDDFRRADFEIDGETLSLGIKRNTA